MTLYYLNGTDIFVINNTSVHFQIYAYWKIRQIQTIVLETHEVAV